MKLRKSSFARFQHQLSFDQHDQQAQYFGAQFNNNTSSNYWEGNQLLNPGKEITWNQDKFSWPSYKNNGGGGGGGTTASSQRQLRLTGKGKYGKRPASSFAIDYGGHSNDNSNDSGLDCDNSNSDSQFWGSTEDLRSLGLVARRHSSAATLVNNGNQLIQHPIQRSDKNNLLSPIDLQRTQSIFTSTIDPTFTSAGQPNQVKEQEIDEKKVLSPSADLKNMSPDNSGQVPDSINSLLPISTIGNGSTLSVKRPRFSFQTPAVPARSSSALRLRNQNQPPGIRGNLGKRLPLGTVPTLSSSVTASSRDGNVQLQILAQPEEQHRARYQTEGSRGAIKDRKGNGFPAVKLIGYDKPATLQVFIGSDQGKVSPHMFYQACKVTGKSSTPCTERKVEGTVLIEIEFEPSKDMVISCDCVGILKERNVDVEQRFPFHHAASSRKKSTRCRLIYRTTIINSSGIQETLQVSSLPILCTQPPGQPEISKKSLSECSCKGGQELFIVGKNFLKDTKVIVQEETLEGEVLWEGKAELLKDYVQQNHLICVLPAYKDENITKPVNCRVSVWSGGKLSEPHHLTYLPSNQTVVYGISSAASVTSIDTQGQSHNLQQQLTHSMLSSEMSMGSGSLMSTSNDAVVPFITQESAASLRQMPELVQVQAPMTTMASLSFENSMMAPVSSMQRQVVSELQEILDHSSQQTLMGAGGENQGMPIGPTSFFGLNLVGPLPMEVTSSFQSVSPVGMSTQTSPICQSTVSTSPMNMFGDMTQQEVQELNRRASHPALDAYEQSATVSSSMPEQLLTLVQPNQESQQLLCPMSTESHVVLNCMNLKSEPHSPDHQIENTCSQQQQQSNNPQIMNVISLMGEELQGGQGSIENALTQMSDNELLSYINPTCFDQDLKVTETN